MTQEQYTQMLAAMRWDVEMHRESFKMAGDMLRGSRAQDRGLVERMPFFAYNMWLFKEMRNEEKYC